MRKLTTMFLAGAMAASLMAVPVQAEEATGTVALLMFVVTLMSARTKKEVTPNA